MSIFVDSSAWTALFNPRDKYHAEAQRAMRHLAERRMALVTTDYVLDETLTNLQHGYKHFAATEFGRWVLRQKNVQVEQITESIWHDAWAMFQRYDDKNFSFTDCTSFVVMHRLKLDEAFTFDHHFEQIGFQLWPR